MNIEKEGYRLFNTDRNEYYPWYTHPALEVLEKIDFSEKTVFEYGAGDSSTWWARRCKRLCCVESNTEWVSAVTAAFAKIGNVTIVHNGNLIQHALADVTDPSLYAQSITHYDCMFDVVIIDGADREACVEPALKKLNPNGMIIYDNWMQPSVEVQSEKTQQRLLAFRHEIYHQPRHADWKTAIFYP